MLLYLQNPADPRYSAVLNANLHRKVKRLNSNTSCLLRKKPLLIKFYVLRASKRCYPLLVKFLRFLALVIARQRSSAFQAPAVDDGVRLPSKNWLHDGDQYLLRLH